MAVDVGCGTGYHLPWFADRAAHVVGIEPHPPLAALARRRTRRNPRIEVREATATATGLPDGSVDLAHARWAYFFGPGCEPGLAELERIIRPGGVAVVLDNDPTRSTFGAWFRRGFPAYDPQAVIDFWTRHGWQRTRVLTSWQFESADDFASVVRIELPTAVAEEFLTAEPGRTGLDYAVNLWTRRF